MQLTHRFTVPTAVEKTWAHFEDVTSVAECFPGAQVTSADADSFAGSVKVKLGPIALVYNGSGTFVEKDEAARRFVVDARGKDKRGNGTASAHVTVTMSDGAGSTDVAVETDLAITGKPAQFGRGVMQDVSDKLLGQFVACLEQRLTPGQADVLPRSLPRRWSLPTPRRTSAGLLLRTLLHPPGPRHRLRGRTLRWTSAQPWSPCCCGRGGSRSSARWRSWSCSVGCCVADASEHVLRAELHRDPGPDMGDLGHGVPPRALTGAAHDHEVAVAHRHRDMRRHPGGLNMSRRRSATLTIVSALRPRPVLSPCQATDSRPSR
jgi:carbon monoxide dehydrogenase subunit G